MRRIAVLRANSVGDLLLTIPVLDALRSAYPDADIALLAAPWAEPFLSGRPGPWDRILPVPPYSGFDHEPAGAADDRRAEAFFADRRAESLDLAVQLHGGGGNSNAFVAGLGARVTVGARAAGAPALDRSVPYATAQHETLRMLEIAALAGAGLPERLTARLQVTPADVTEASAALAEAGLPVDGPGNRPLVTVHAGANDSRRRWPAERFAVVADALAERGAVIVTVGSVQDAAASAEVAGAARSPVTDLTGRLSLGGTAGLLARASLFVGNDSGPRHLADAVGTSTVSVFWVGNLLGFGPLQRARHRVALSMTPVTDVAAVPVTEVLGAAIEAYDRETATGAGPSAGVPAGGAAADVGRSSSRS